MRLSPAYFAAPPAAPALGKGQIHLWRIALDGVSATTDLLSAHETDRVERLISARARGRRTAAFAGLRTVLANYLDGRAPGELSFTYGTEGKPALDPGEIEFNLSHSAGVALLAVSANPVGVDIEALRDVPRMQQVAARVFPTELTRSMGFEHDSARLAFFTHWTGFEAGIKLAGHSVFDRERFTAPRWQHSFGCGPTHIATLASNADVASLRFYQFRA